MKGECRDIMKSKLFRNYVMGEDNRDSRSNLLISNDDGLISLKQVI